jgi:thiol-disulfide isomerase/thioredoxin
MSGKQGDILSNSNKSSSTIPWKAIGFLFLGVLVVVGITLAIILIPKMTQNSQNPRVVKSSQNPRLPPTQPLSTTQPQKPRKTQTSNVVLLDNDDVVRDQLLDDAVVMVYAEWCPHCKTTTPEFFKASIASDTPFFAINGPKCPDAVAALGVKGYPTIIRVKPNESTPQIYKGDRKSASLIAFSV